MEKLTGQSRNSYFKWKEDKIKPLENLPNTLKPAQLGASETNTMLIGIRRELPLLEKSAPVASYGYRFGRDETPSFPITPLPRLSWAKTWSKKKA